MKNAQIFVLGLASSALLAATTLGGCGDGSSGTGGAGGAGSSSSSTSSQSSSSSSSSSGGFTPPALGAQLDRMGRPAVNTALNHTFDTNMMAQGAAKDAYNADKDPTKWAANHGKEFAANLAVFDGLDTVCGNQLLAGMAGAGRYDNLGNAMADDRLWIKTDAAACMLYLAVELDATNIQKNMDCGGRKLDYDPVDASYSALTIGMPSGVTDGVPADADTKGTTFPYLAAPHP